jgi:hypothetical protein
MSEPMSGADAAWYRMDDAVQQAVIATLIVFDREPDVAALRARIAARVLQHTRFRQRVLERAPFAPHWKVDDELDLHHHVRHVRVRTTLRELVSELVSTPLDSARPLWQLDVIEGERAVLFRVHHCVADGVALVRVLLGTIDEGEELAPAEVGWSEPPKKRGALRTLARTLSLRRDPASVLHGPLGARKEVAWTRAIALEPLHAHAHAASATLNDVFTAAVAGGLRRWSRAIGRPIEQDVRALVPVFIRGGHERSSLGNAFGLVYATLPVSVPEPASRVEHAKRTMDAIKRTPEPSNALAVLGAIGRLSPGLEHAAVKLLSRRASLVLTNVPGPPMPVHLAGLEVESVVVWAPVSGTVTLGITAFTYRGELRVGVRADPRAIPSVELLAGSIEHELTTNYGGRTMASAPS